MDPTMELPRQEPSEPVQAPPEIVERRVKKPIRVIVSRVYTIAILVISLALLLTVLDNKATNVDKKNFSLMDLASQRFIFIAIIVGSGCNLLQLGIVIYCMTSIKGKHIANNKYKIFFDYYTDKAVSLLLAISVGAGLGSLLDISQLHALTQVGSFFSIQKVSTALLSTVLVSTSISYSCSEKALKKYKESLDKKEEAVGFFGSWVTRLYNFLGIKVS